MTKCPNCGNELVSVVKGSALIVHCTNRDYSIATSYIDPIYEDLQEYEVLLIEGNTVTKENYFLLQSLTGMNITELKYSLDTVPYSLFKGSAADVRELKEKLDECNVKYEIIPEFNY